MSGFPTTHGSAVLGASSADAAVRERSFAALVAAYWRPVYAYLRLARRRSPEDAEDLTQGFFADALDEATFAGFEPGRARFRTYLRVCLDRFAMDQDKKARRLKRGGGAAHLALDFDGLEAELARANAAPSPEELFEREWRRSVLGLTVDALERELAAAGKADWFALFERFDLAEGERPTYAALAAELGVPVTTVTNRLAFVRRELRRLALARLEELTASPRELRSEARALLGVELSE